MQKTYIAVGLIAVLVLSFLVFQFVGKKDAPKILSEQDIQNQGQEAGESNETGEGEGIGAEDLDQADEEDLAKVYNDMSVQCEKGEWFDVQQVSGEKKTFTGRFSVDLPLEDDDVSDEAQIKEIYYLNDDKEIISTKDEVLGFFEGREVEIQGVEESGKINPEKIRCAGKETNRDVLAFRQEIMNYVNKNIATLSPQKGEWEIYDIAWPSDDHVYVDFAAMESEDGEASDENVYSLLLQVSRQGSEIKTTQVAFLKMADEQSEEEWVTISGTDKFKDLEDMDYYEYDDEVKKWVK